MKKLLALALAIIMLLAIVACDTNKGEQSTQKGTDAATEGVTEPVVSESEKATRAETEAVDTETDPETTPETTPDTTPETDPDKDPETDPSVDPETDDGSGEETEGGDEIETDPSDDTQEDEDVKINYVTEYPYVDRDGIIHITFQDTYDFGSAIAEIRDQDVTSFKTGKTEKDDAVLEIRGNAVYASGCGMATVVLENGREECVIVHASPINLFFLTGQSNGSGDPPDPSTYEKGEYQKYFKRSPETMAYYTWTGQGLSIYSAEDYVTKTLEWDNMGAKNGCPPGVLTALDYSSGFANFSVCAGMAYEWIEQTGERVWIVNASHGGQPIHCFKPSEDGSVVDNDYYQAVTVFNLALETLYREVDAGHFTLNHMAYYWFQGEGDSTNTYEYYYDAFAEMHEAMQKDVVYKHNGVEKKLEYCGIFTIRSGSNGISELFLSGPRLAQYTAANKLEGAYANVFLATKATENWIISDANVENYFLDVYGSNENFKAIFGYDIPKTLNTVHPQIHYRIFGQNEMGVDAMRNTLQFLNYLNPDKNYTLTYEQSDEVTLRLVGIDGHYDLGDTIYFDAGRMTTQVVPYITPVWKTVQGLSLKVLTDGFEVDGFIIKSSNATAKEITIEIYLGDKLLDTRTFKVAYNSSFANNKPLIVNYGTALYPDRRFEGYMPGWDAGFLTYSTGEFTVYDKVEENGWLYDGENLWAGHGGFYLTAGMRIGAVDKYKDVGALGIRYTAGKSGQVKISATTFTPNLSSCYVAVFVNGEMVWPKKVDGNPSNYANWQVFSTAATESTINKMWADLVLDVEEGDEIVFAVARYDSNPQAILYPAVEYID